MHQGNTVRSEPDGVEEHQQWTSHQTVADALSSRVSPDGSLVTLARRNRMDLVNYEEDSSRCLRGAVIGQKDDRSVGTNISPEV